MYQRSSDRCRRFGFCVQQACKFHPAPSDVACHDELLHAAATLDRIGMLRHVHFARTKLIAIHCPASWALRSSRGHSASTFAAGDGPDYPSLNQPGRWHKCAQSARQIVRFKLALTCGIVEDCSVLPVAKPFNHFSSRLVVAITSADRSLSGCASEIGYRTFRPTTFGQIHTCRRLQLMVMAALVAPVITGRAAEVVSWFCALSQCALGGYADEMPPLHTGCD